MLRLAKALGVIAVSVAGLQSASATVAVALSVPHLAREAHAIVHGEILMAESFWDHAKQRIYTHTRVRVLRGLKAPVADKEILVRQWGGRVGNVTMAVPGNAELRPGEEVVLFLKRDAQYHYVVGLAQGKFSVSLDRAGRKVLSRDLSGIGFASWDARGRMAIGKRWELEKPLYLDTLEAEIKAALSK